MQGATTRAQDAKIPGNVINKTNHWNIGQEDVIHGPMCVVY